jgi:hypothetical protein
MAKPRGDLNGTCAHDQLARPAVLVCRMWTSGGRRTIQRWLRRTVGTAQPGAASGGDADGYLCGDPANVTEFIDALHRVAGGTD